MQVKWPFEKSMKKLGTAHTPAIYSRYTGSAEMADSQPFSLFPFLSALAPCSHLWSKRILPWGSGFVSFPMCRRTPFLPVLSSFPIAQFAIVPEFLSFPTRLLC